MADLLSRLLLDTGGYEKGMAKAKRAMHGYAQENKNFENIVKGIGPTLTKMAGGLGVVMTAGEGFNKMMENSQFFGDKMTVTINSAKGAVNEFFYALGTGDFTSFMSGLDNIISRAADAERALDQLGNTRMSYSFVRAENNRLMAEGKAKANNKTLSKEERDSGFTVWEEALKRENEYAENLGTAIEEAVKAMAITNTELKGVTMEDIKKIARLDIKNPSVREDEKGNLANRYEEYQQKRKDLSKVDRNTVWENGKIIGRRENGEFLDFEQQKVALAKEYSDAILYNNLLNRKNDEQWQDIINKMIEADDVIEELGSKYEELNNAKLEYKNSSAAEINKVAPVGSIAELDEKIKAASKAYAEATSDAARVAAKKTLDALKGQKVELEVRVKYPNAPGAVEGSSTGSLASLAQIPEIPTTIEINANTNFEAQTEKANEFTESLYGISGAIGSIGSAVNGETGAMIQYFANVMEGTLQVAAAIQALIPLKKEEMNVNAKNAAAAAAGSVAGIPIVGPMMAVAAIASLVAAISAIPNFADGGIVPGSNFRDGIRANVSSGEMFINQHDQSRLFKAIKSGNFGGGGGDVVLTGEKLVMCINNYGKRNGKGIILK